MFIYKHSAAPKSETTIEPDFKQAFSAAEQVSHNQKEMDSTMDSLKEAEQEAKAIAEKKNEGWNWKSPSQK